MKKIFLYGTLLMFLANCAYHREFTAQENQAYEELQSLVASKSFKIESNSASPIASGAFSRVANSNILGPGNTANHIDITTNANYLIVKGDSIKAFLPYFGEQTFGGSYGGTHTGIEFNDTPKTYDVNHNDKKHTVDIKFKIDDEYRNSDHYTVIVTLYPNKRSIIQVQSTTRSSIEYLGRVEAFDPEEAR